MPLKTARITCASNNTCSRTERHTGKSPLSAMGDCRIRIQISKEVLPDRTAEEDLISSRLWASDATVREVAEHNVDDNDKQLTILKLLNSHSACLWDCTRHPATNITSWPMNDFKEKQGSNSMTLHSAGWFPSGFLQVTPLGAVPVINNHHEDFQYNKPLESSTTVASNLISLTGSGQHDRPLPSQLLESVSHRFDAQNDPTADDAARVARKQRQQAKDMQRQQRMRKLDERIQKFQGKTSKSSIQVRNMLIKSRATGQTKLMQEDRVYLSCVIDDGTQIVEEYRFFSRLDTVGKILNAFEKVPTRTAELLVGFKTNEKQDGFEYRRLPTLLRLYEAMEQNVLNIFSQVVVRWYDPTNDEATPSIDEDQMDTVDEAFDDRGGQETLPHNSAKEPRSSVVASQAQGKEGKKHDAEELELFARLLDSIRTLGTSQTGKKKNSAAAVKVQQMKMKSSAKGDGKRVQLERRFYLELVVVIDSISSCTASSSPVFLSNSDQIERIVRDCANLKEPMNAWNWELFALQGDEPKIALWRISNTTLTLQEAEQCKLLAQFGRIVLRAFPN